MLASAHTMYELKENIMSAVRACQELGACFRGARRTLGSQGMP